MKNLKNTLLYFTLLLVFFISFGSYIKLYEIYEDKPIRDFTEITDTKDLNVVISSNFIDYFVYNGRPMGFYLEILSEFANDYGLNLNLFEESDHINALNLINDNKCDIFAADIVLPVKTRSKFDLTVPLRTTKQVLVQRKPDGYIYMSQQQIKDSLIRNYSGLSYKTIYAKKNGNNFFILNKYLLTKIDSLSTEDIIKNVSNKVFDYAICDYNFAKIFNSYYPNIDIELPLSFRQNVCWVVRKNSTDLRDTLDSWLTNFKKTKKYSDLERKYITNNRILLNINSEYYSGNEGKISKYDELLKKYSAKLGWDWRLLSSLVFEESRFDPKAESWAGALGLMQLMPFTYESFSNDTTWQIESQISAGVKYIEYLYNLLPEEANDSVSRTKMVLAGYNIGFGHVEDAINLARKYNKNPGSWEDISYFLTNLSKQKYYSDTVVKFGYFPGIYAVDFANSIYNRFLHYKNVIPE
ncbi:MAG: transglycosylase SLT domain-containing protein [Bacteroidales bacterium]|jgi:membrane-bound lytic murein transglycosylase F|nr:transglycosylase SLT domain-containing protein [Bacteroidales bacterium]